MVIYEIEETGLGMNDDMLMNQLDKNIVPNYNSYFGEEYHVSVTLLDDTYLPCVALRHLGKAIDLIYGELHKPVLRGITSRRAVNQEDVQRDKIENLLQSNIIYLSDIKKIEKCKFSFPEMFLKRLKFQPTNFFLAKFKDGSFENFRSNMGLFYELPEDKNFEEIQEVYDSELILKNGNIIKLKNLSDWGNNQSLLRKIYVNKPYFCCYFGGTWNENDFNDKLKKVRRNFK
ncbi:hypothetical protein [Chryseobacterium gleum]|uniref:hypothetical protein n=1 Tax=Chryseobacterium gleum TaxID=250 RepID=UPI00241E8A95|nr:hypothetical protein [Chryseobacterium gleum]